MDTLYQDGRDYDLMFPRHDDVPFFLGYARALGGPVLELACGTGRILQPIADAGFATTGIDLAPGMLDEARRKAQAASSSIRYLQADMRQFSLDERFALIFIAGNSLWHLLDIDSFDACMACVRQHLATGGRFIIDVFVPNLRRLLADPQVRERLTEYDDPDGAGHVVVTQTSRYDAITQITSATTYRRDARGNETQGSLALRMYFPQELQALLRHNGLQLVEAFGGYDRCPLTSGSPRQLYVVGAAECRPAPSAGAAHPRHQAHRDLVAAHDQHAHPP